MGLKERRKKIMALMLAACVAGTSTVPVTASDISVFSDGTNAEPEVFDSSDVATAANTNTQKNVTVIYVDETDRQIDTDTIQVPANAKTVNVVQGEFKTPDNYELVSRGDIAIKDNGSLILKVKPAVKDVTVIYVDETDRQIATDTIQVPANAKTVSVVQGKFKTPDNYELVSRGDIAIKDNGSLILKVKPAVKDVTVIYVDETDRQIATDTIQVPANAKTVSVVQGKFKTPDNYELVSRGDIAIKDNGSLILKVKPAVKDVKVTYVDAENGKVVDTANVKVPSDATKVSVIKGKFDAPKGYELVTVGDFLIKNGGITLKVKASVKDVKVTYVDAENGKVVETSTVQVPCNATSVSVVKGKFYTPEGYELVTLGDLSIENNTLTVKVKAIPKKVGKTVKITYKLSKTKKVIATRKIVVDKKATSIKASSIPVPTGYKMVSSGNCSVRTRKITIYVTK